MEYEAEKPWTDVFEGFLAAAGASDVRALVVGNWGDVSTGTDSSEVVRALVAARGRLPKLEAIFLGDVTFEESEISWIHQSDVSPLFSAYPKLTHFRVRGGNGLSLGSLEHGELRSLVVETGGLDASVVRQVAAATLPNLEHLELWLGSHNSGANWEMEDLAPILAGEHLPALKTLALRDSEDADAIALAVSKSPILARLSVLDLSLGALSDDGGEALLACPAIKRLTRLDLHRHYMSDAMSARLKSLGIDVNLDDPQGETADKADRYVAVSE